MSIAAALILAYLLGSVPFGLLIGLAVGRIDIRTVGSKNVGATNVGRNLGLGWGLLCFVLDFGKGIIPVALCLWLLPAVPLAALAAAAGSILGHVFSIFLRGRGGKGVATSAGALALLTPWALLAALLAWGVMLALFRIMSVASLSAATTLVATEWAVGGDLWLGGFCTLLAVLVFWRHRSNLARLLGRREPALASSHQNQECVPGSSQDGEAEAAGSPQGS